MLPKALSVTLVICSLIITHSTSLVAGVIPGDWRKVDAQPSGTQIAIALKSGDLLIATLKEVDQDTLVLETDAGERGIPKLAVAQIEESETPNSLLFRNSSQLGRQEITARHPISARVSTLGKTGSSESRMFTGINYILPDWDQLFLIRDRLWKKCQLIFFISCSLAFEVIPRIS